MIGSLPASTLLEQFEMTRLLALAACLLVVPSSYAAQKDIVDTADEAGSFNTLVAAVKAAGLVDTLKSPGPFTVFAPTDDAFAKLPPGTVEELLKPENKQKLVDILTYHVVPGKVMAADAIKLDGQSAKTVLGATAPIRVQEGSVYIGNAKVVQTDIDATNGVIHVIDTVLLPPTPQTPATITPRSVDIHTAPAAVQYAATPTWNSPYMIATPYHDSRYVNARPRWMGGLFRRGMARTCR